MDNTISTFITTAVLAINTVTTSLPVTTPNVLADHQIILSERVPGGGYMSDVMADNILLNLAYLNHDPIDPKNVDWSKVRSNRTISFKLNPDQTFAFQEGILPEYDGKIALTTNAHFSSSEGFKYDGYLIGDGVCHLASLFNWVGRDAGLKVEAPTNHNFAAIPGIDQQYGTAIFYQPGSLESNAKQNLYITNTKNHPVEFDFIIDGAKLEAKIIEL